MVIQSWKHCDDFNCRVNHNKKKLIAWRKTYNKLNRQRKTILQYNKRNPLKPKPLPPIVPVVEIGKFRATKGGYKPPKYGNELWKQLCYEDYIAKQKKGGDNST